MHRKAKTLWVRNVVSRRRTRKETYSHYVLIYDSLQQQKTKQLPIGTISCKTIVRGGSNNDK